MALEYGVWRLGLMDDPAYGCWPDYVMHKIRNIRAFVLACSTPSLVSEMRAVMIFIDLSARSRSKVRVC